MIDSIGLKKLSHLRSHGYEFFFQNKHLPFHKACIKNLIVEELPYNPKNFGVTHTWIQIEE